MKKLYIIIITIILLFCGCAKTEIPKVTPTPETSAVVYVSQSGKIHKKANCSGMKKYKTMSYEEAIKKYVKCKKCY